MAKKDLIYKKYRRSIYVDSGIWIALGMLLSLGMSFVELSLFIRLLSIIPTGLIVFGYLASDYFFKKQSMGKQLLKLQLTNKSGPNKKLELRQIIKRRLLEFVMMYFMGRRGYDLYHALEEDTNSMIIEVAKH